MATCVAFPAVADQGLRQAKTRRRDLKPANVNAPWSKRLSPTCTVLPGPPRMHRNAGLAQADSFAVRRCFRRGRRPAGSPVPRTVCSSRPTDRDATWVPESTAAGLAAWCFRAFGLRPCRPRVMASPFRGMKFTQAESRETPNLFVVSLVLYDGGTPHSWLNAGDRPFEQELEAKNCSGVCAAGTVCRSPKATERRDEPQRL